MFEEAVLVFEINILRLICRADSDQNQSAMENVNGTNRNVPEQYQCASSKSNIHHEYPYWIYELLDHAENPEESPNRSFSDSYNNMHPYNIPNPNDDYYMNGRNYNGVQSFAINGAPMNIGMHQSHSSSCCCQFAERSRVQDLIYIAELERNVKALENQSEQDDSEIEFLKEQNSRLSLKNEHILNQLKNTANI
ncbi:hypothetical protein ZOSMA_621G00040 [Zostera marina]|uniref:Uncharacterized protein n=1 Tax=Zostera marina TaxID=29655 RepID=A0A0K9NTA1_ZOSMR|nr:hypothetical protein ZOSMA_621G00040 [Zostera marina]